MGFIDIHSHFAWDVDDGIEDREQAKLALANAQEDGIEQIIATPHFIPGKQGAAEVEAINRRIGELKTLALSYGIEIFWGSELFLNDAYLDMIDAGLFNTLANSGYALCEFDVRRDIGDCEEAEDMLYEFEVRDMIPVIAHVERYFHKGVDLERVRNWAEQGYVIQVNRTSFIGSHGSTAQKNAMKLLRSGLIHVVATDAHRAAGARIGKLSDAYAIVKEEVGRRNADLLFAINPQHIIANEEIEWISIPEKKKSILSRLRRR